MKLKKYMNIESIYWIKQKTIYLKTSNGFSMVEMLVAVLLISFSIVLLNGCLKVISKVDPEIHITEDIVSIDQIRLIYALSNERKIIDNMLNLNYFNRKMHFELKKGKILIQPGYQVFFNNIQYGSFKEDDKCIFLEFKRKGEMKSKNIVIGCK